MKNLTKIFVAVALLFAGFACTTDATEDLGVNVGGQTTLTFSLEESRTQLGEKVDGVYPLYWSAEDQLSVNGVASATLSAEQAGKASATFTFNGALNYPYNVVYPASNGNEVTFLANQTYTAGTFCAGAAPMYGYAVDATTAIQMNHLAGALRFAISGEVTLSSIVVSAEGADLSGTFAIDCATGALTAIEGATSNSVTLSFGEGLILGAEATPVYVAVPAGSYGNVDVTINATNGEKMTLKFDSEAKPIAAGKVREFIPVVFEGVVADEFVIDSKEALIAFAANPTKSARVTAAIDMTGYDWTPIEGFAHTFDGGNFEIKGLNAPLFGATNGSFVDVKLVDVNITETVNPNVAALARNIKATDTVTPVVQNCSASGKITVNCTEYVPTESPTHTNCAVAGLVGHSTGTLFVNCTNGVELDVKQVIKEGNTVSNVVCVGGISGFTYPHKCADGTLIITSAENCENKANINVVEKSFTTPVSAEGAGTFAKTSLWVGGLFGSDYSSSGVSNAGAVAKNLTNRGNITVEASTNDLFVAGITANSYQSERDNLVNHGKLSVVNTDSARTFMGGTIACIQGSVLANSANYGEIYTANSSTRTAYIGGVLGYNKSKINACENNGVLNIDYNAYSRSAAYADVKDFALGGVVGSTTSADSNELFDCTNKGAMNISGNLFSANAKAGYYGIGGVVGLLRCTIKRSKNEGNITIKANTSHLEDGSNADGAYLHIGGAVGSCLVANYNDETFHNSGNVTIESGTHNNFVDVAGLVGYASKRVGGVSATHCVNTGNVTLGKEGETLTFNKIIHVSGGSAHPLTWVVDIDNHGTISVAKGVTVGSYSYIGGCAGRAYFTDANVTRCHNYGAIDLAGTFNCRVIVGGMIGEARNNPATSKNPETGETETATTGLNITDCTNSGKITLKNGFSANHTESTTVGGIAGVWASSNAGLKRSTNSGVITIENGATFAPESRIAGICATPDSGDIVEVTNTGDLALGGTHTGRLCAGGILGYATAQIPTGSIGATNNGTISFVEGGKCKELELGGICGITKKALRNSVNNGDVVVAGEVTGTIARVAGGIGWINDGGMNTITNHGNVTIKSAAKMASTVVGQIGGVSGINQKSNTNAFNTGTITIEEGVTFANGTMVAGCIADVRAGATNFTNTGDINILCELASGNGWLVGGCVGKTADNKSLTNIQCYCTMNASVAQFWGFLVGSARTSTIKVTSGAMGGSYKKYDIDDEIYLLSTLTSNDYFNYIYGGNSIDWTGTNYDGVTFLNEAPVIE